MIAPGPRINGGEDEYSRTSDGAGRSDVDPLHKLIGQFMEVRKYAADYLAAEADLFRAIARRWIIHALVGMVVAFIGLTGLITAVVFALHGLAWLISDLSGIPWLGELIIGFGSMAVLAIVGWLVLSGRSTASRRRTISKYDLKHRAEEVARRHADERTTN